MKKVLLALAAVLLLCSSVVAGPDLHLKAIYYGGSSLLAPGVGVYYLGTTPWGFMIEHSVASMDFESAERGCAECDVGEIRWTLAGVWDVQVFYDVPLGGCDPGPCDRGKLRVGGGLAVPAYLATSTVHGIEFGASEFGLVVGAGYVFDAGELKDCSARWEVYWNWNRNDLGSALSLHCDLFSVGDWVRGRGGDSGDQ